MLHSDRTLDAQFARNYFKQLDRKKRKLLKQKKKERILKLKLKKQGDTKWMRDEANAITDSIVSFFKHEPNFSLNFKQMMISDAIIKTLKDRKLTKIKANRTTHKPYAKAVIEIADQLAVWIDTITRYLDAQSVGDLEALPSLSEIEDESEEEEEELSDEEEEEEMDEEEEKKGEETLEGLTTPHISDFEGEGRGTTGTEGLSTPQSSDRDGAGEKQGTVTDKDKKAGKPADGVKGELVASDIAAELSALDDNSLEILIQILSSSTPEALQKPFNEETVPGITYGEILDKLKLIRQEPPADTDLKHDLLADTILKWAKENDEQKVTPPIEDKIHETANILADWLRRDTTVKGWEGALLSAEETTATTDEGEHTRKPLAILPEEVETDLAVFSPSTPTTTDEESPSPFSTGDTGDTTETAVIASDLDTTHMLDEDFVTDTPAASDIEDYKLATSARPGSRPDDLIPKDVAVDLSGKPILGPDGAPVPIALDEQVVFNAEGSPSLDKDGRPIIIPSDRRVTRLPDGGVLLDTNGHPLLTPEGYQIALGIDGKPLLGSDTEPLVIPTGTQVSLTVDGKPLIGKDGLVVVEPYDEKKVAVPQGKPTGDVPSEDADKQSSALKSIPLPDGTLLLGDDGEPLMIRQDEQIALQPDGKPMFGADGQPIRFPVNKKLLLQSDGTPLLDGYGKPVTVPTGEKILLQSDGTPLLDGHGKPVIVPAGEGEKPTLVTVPGGKADVKHLGEFGQATGYTRGIPAEEEIGAPLKSLSSLEKRKLLAGREGEIIRAHSPPAVFEHEPGKICCLSLKVWASWLIEVAENARKWSKWLNEIISEVRRIVRIIKGEVKDESGKPQQFYKEDWVAFSKKVEDMTVSWRQYSQHVRDLTEKLTSSFHGKAVECCAKCLEDNLITDVPAIHGVSEQLNEAVNTALYWRRWLDSIVEQTSRLTSAFQPKEDDEDVIEVVPPGTAESDVSIISEYIIEELDICACNPRT